MPVNFTAEYLKAEQKFLNAKTTEEKIVYLEEMIRVCPKHKGAENLLAQLHAKLAKLKREVERASKKNGGKREGIRKEGDAQVCLVGDVNVGKSSILKKITNADPEIDEYPYTTVQPEIGMMDYNGVKIQIVEIPSTFRPEYMAIARTADLVAVVYNGSHKHIDSVLDSMYIRTKRVHINVNDNVERIKNKIWKSLNLIIVYTKNGKDTSPMALKKGSIVRDFTLHIHKDFVKNFWYARLWRGSKEKQVGLNYILKDRDVVEVKTKMK